TFIGYRAGEENTTGSSNTSIGYLAGDNNRTGINNTYLGARAGQNNQSGSFNVFLGNQAGTSETGSNKLYIDNSSTSAPLIYGDFSTNELSVNGQLGVGIQNPAYPFHVESNAIVGIQYNGNQSNNAFAGSYMNGARPFYGYKQNGLINAYHYLDADKNFRLWLNNGEKMVIDKDGQLGLGIAQPERPIHLRATNAIFRIDRDRDDPGFAVVRYDQGFQNVWKSFYFYTRGFGPNNGKFIIADWQQNVAGPSTARLVIANNGNVGIGDFLFSNPSQKLTVTGNAQANAFFTSSDKRFKRNIQGIPEALSSLEKMQGVRYEFKQEEFEQQQFSEGPAIGLIAQEVQKVYPELVAEDEEGYLS
ncbi:MAG: tail fiber domain-containing protein, partial [Bacteroidota bacterium]